jgi:hypothetical protein
MMAISIMFFISQLIRNDQGARTERESTWTERNAAQKSADESTKLSDVHDDEDDSEPSIYVEQTNIDKRFDVIY